MEEINWNTVRITVPYNMGKLNEKKMDILTEQLNKNGFTVNARINSPDGAAVFILCQGKDNLILASNQFTYINSIEDNKFDWESLEKKIKLILDTLLIDDDLKYVFNFEGDSEAENSHEESRKQYIENNKSISEDIFGVGYRFLIKNENFEGEYKIEPMINDKKKYYYQLILNTLNNGMIDHVIACVSREIEKRRDFK